MVAPRTRRAPSTISSAAGRGGDQGRRHARSTFPTRSAMPTPEEFRDLIHDAARAACRTPTRSIFSTHCHNDLGMAVANSLAGVEGRRAADRMHDQRPRRARRQRRARGGRDGDQDARRPAALLDRHRHDDADARLASWSSAVSAFPVQYNKAIVGTNAFAHEIRHPPGRHAQERPDLRDHDARESSA